MTKTIDYFFSTSSPWTYLGHERFRAMCRKHGGSVSIRPIDLGGKIFPISGGLPLKQRAPQRRAYRLVELRRWRDHLGIPLTLEPKYFPADGEPSARLIIAASLSSEEAGMALTFAILRACWAQERNIADRDTLRAILEEQGLSTEALDQAEGADTKARYDAYTQEAIDKGVFGAPTYIFGGEMFWGQDRLDFLERALARTA